MKNKIISVFTAAALSAALFTGCNGGNASDPKDDNTAKSVAAEAGKILSAANSIESRFIMELSGSASAAGTSADISLNLACDIESIFDPAASHITEELNLNYAGTPYSETVESYTVTKDGQVYTYTRSGNEWNKFLGESSEASDDSDNIFTSISDGTLPAEMSVEASSEGDIPEKEYYILSLELSPEYIDELFSLSTNTENDMFSTLEATDAAMDAKLFVDPDSFEPVLISISCPELGESLIRQQLGTSEIDCTIDSYTMDFYYDSFNELDKIDVPDEIKNSASSGDGASSASSDAEMSEASKELTDKIEAAKSIAYDPADGTLDMDFSLTIDNEKYEIPVDYSALTENGWTISDTADGIVSAGDYDLDYMNRGNSSIVVNISNPSSEDKEYADCKVSGINVSSDMAAGSSVVLSSGIALSASSLDDVLEAYGKPSNYYVSDSMIYLDYSSIEGYKVLGLYFDAETLLLNEIDIQNTAAE